MNETEQAILSTLSNLSPTIAAEYDDQQAAITAERDAEASLLEKIVTLILPALPAISSRIPASGDSWSPDKVKSTFDFRGFCLADHFDREDPDCRSGNFSGTRLYLLTDGRLAEAKAYGSWSQRAGTRDEWSATLTIKSAREVMDEYDLDEILQKFLAAIQEQAGKRGASAKKAKERTEKLRALAQLV